MRSIGCILIPWKHHWSSSCPTMNTVQIIWPLNGQMRSIGCILIPWKHHLSSSCTTMNTVQLIHLVGCQDSRAQIQTNSSASESSDVKSQPFGQLKVLHRGCWENLKYERVNSQYATENESHKKSTNPWVQHFRSPSTAKAPHLTSPYQMGENDLVNQSVDFINRRHGREAISSEKPSPFCSRKVHKVSIGIITEVSDQNFLDMDIERGEELSGRCSAKRARSAASPITDQVVPFVPPTSEKTAFLKENNENDSKVDVESTAESLQISVT